jgi:hypothetical protein
MQTHLLSRQADIETRVYDDELGVVAEPFVLGADTVLTLLRSAKVGPDAVYVRAGAP